ncbi:MAG: hypothetical protein RLY58_2345 [Pseudomonadota bacterium]|jgi:hypothetical protein
MAEGYSDEVWNALRDAWENTPKISFQKLVDEVGTTLGCPMPSPSVVRRRSMAECWQKQTAKILRRSTRSTAQAAGKKKAKSTSKKPKSDVKSDVKSDDDDHVESDVISDDQDFDKNDESKEKNYQILTSNSGQTGSQKSAFGAGRKSTLKGPDMLAKIRSQVIRQMAFFDVFFDSVEHVRDIQLEIIEKQNAGLAVDEHAVQEATRKLNFVASLAELNDQNTRAMERAHRSAALFWGMDAADFVDRAEIEAKNKATMQEMDQQLKARKERLRAGRVEMMHRRADMLDNPDDVPQSGSVFEQSE